MSSRPEESRRGCGKETAVELLVQQKVAGAVAPEDLQAISCTIVEDHQGAAHRIKPELLARRCRERLEGAAKIDGCGREKNRPLPAASQAPDRRHERHHRVFVHANWNPEHVT